MAMLRICVIWILSALVPWSVIAHENDKKTHDHKEAAVAEYEKLVPIVRDIVSFVQTPQEGAKQVAVNYQHIAKPGDITPELLAEYDAFFSFILKRKTGQVFAPGGIKKAHAVDLVEAYRQNANKPLENLAVYYEHSNTCNDECLRILFEKYANSMTIVADMPVPIKAGEPFGEKKYETRAVRHSIATDCDPGNNPYSLQRSVISEIPVLGLCVQKEDVNVPDKLIYQGSTSPLWPREYKMADPSKRRQKVFQSLYFYSLGEVDLPDLEELKIHLINYTHWAKDTQMSPPDKPQLTFEAACFSPVPGLPKSALQLLQFSHARRFKINTWPHNLQLPGNGVICFGAEQSAGPITKHASFFPPEPRAYRTLDLVRALSIDDIVERINNFAIPEAKHGQYDQNRMKHVVAFQRTLEYLTYYHPEFRTKIAPRIIDKIFALANSGNMPDRNNTIRLLSYLPKDSLSEHVDELEEFLDNALKSSRCKEWVCEERVLSSLARPSLVSVLAASGQKGAELLDRANKAGLPNIDQTMQCMGVLPPKMQAKYLENYKNQKSFLFATIDLEHLPIPEKLPHSPKLVRLFQAAFDARKTGPAGRHSSMNLVAQYSLQGKKAVFYNGIDSEIVAYFWSKDLMEYVNYLEIGAYTYAKALSGTTHSEEVEAFLEERLEQLQNQDDNEPVKTLDLEGMPDKIIIHGHNIKELANSKTLRTMEIKNLSGILNNWAANNDECIYRKFPQSY